ncbi:IclR family transcriptional regulator [Promicromonospora sp. MS192]|uniref:IclR family transcriptional regulator n=1 Tax=Promicromonospora sp. MS192 TaxID=3412684 RepID=UPI003C2E8399
MTEATTGGDGVRSVHRALDLLGHFDEQHTSRSVRDLVEASGLAKSTVVRLVTTLEHAGMLWTRGDGRIVPGVGLMRWSRLAQATWAVPPEAMDVLRQLGVDCGGESSRVYVRQGASRVCIAQQEGTQQLRHVVRVGDGMPVVLGATGHALLTGLPAEQVAALGAAAGRGPDFAAGLVRTVEQARQQGWAASHGEREPGVSALAAPVVTPAGDVVAAVGLGGPTSRFTADHLDTWRPFVVEAAGRLAEIPFFGGIA